ncbi:MAG: alpha/beta fold hydrolase [Gammaproteobacteria bacterium]
MIALHAGIGSAQEWRSLGERLRFAYRVLAPDLYGYATSGDTPLSLDAEAALIEPLIDAFRGPVYLVGHDYGAAVALKLAQRHGERVAGLVLYEPAAFGLLADPTSDHAALEILVLRRVLGRYLDAGDWFRAALRYVDHCSGADAWGRLSIPQRATIASRMPELCARLDAALADPMPPSGYAGIDVPVLLLSSARSRVSAARIAQRLARAEWHKVDGAGLEGIDSHPEAVEREIEDFLARHQASWYRDKDKAEGQPPAY